MSLHATYEDKELIALLKQKDHDAFKFLYDKFSPAIYSVILDIVGDKECADQVVQDTFMFVWQKIDAYDAVNERIFTWMLRIARHTAVAEARTASGNQRHSHARSNGFIYKQADHTRLDEYGLKKLFKKLNQENMTLIELCYCKDFTDDEIASALNIPPETVRVKIKSALSELRTMLT